MRDKLGTWHKVIFGDSKDMREIPDGSIHLMVTSPPYYNAPFDYPGLFKDYREFLQMMRDLGKELFRAMAKGRIVCFVTDDILVDGEKFPIVADTTRIMLEAGFRYRDKIIWRKPEGYIRISRRSGLLLRHPYPMYFYPDNLQESILLFQKGRFDYSSIKMLDENVKQASRIDPSEYLENKWFLTVWDIVNVLPIKGRLEEGIAAFPKEIPHRLIRLFSYVGETVLDPFLGSGTTTLVAEELGRNSYGYEIDLELKPVIAEKIKIQPSANRQIEMIERSDAKKLRSFLQANVPHSQKSRCHHYEDSGKLDP